MTQTDATTVSNPEAASDAVSSAAASGTGSDLDSLLKEFEGGTKNSNPELAKVVKAMSPVIRRAERQEAEEAEAKFKEELSTFIKAARKGAADDFPDELVEGYLHKMVSDDPRAKAAFENRHNAPREWDSYLEKANPKIVTWAERFNKPAVEERPEPVSDVKRAEAAVRNVSTEPLAVEPLDATAAVHHWSDRQWDDYKRKAYAAQQAAKR